MQPPEAGIGVLALALSTRILLPNDVGVGQRRYDGPMAIVPTMAESEITPVYLSPGEAGRSGGISR